MNIEVVLARYQEDISWIENVTKISWIENVTKVSHVLVYNKGGMGDGLALPNVGREAHTYFHHIIENYENLADWTFFSQDDPLPHCPDFVDIINDFPQSEYRCVFHQDGGPLFFVSTPVRFLEKDPPGDDFKNDVRGLWRELFMSDFPSDILFAPGAIFAISRERLLSRSVAFYKKAMELACSRRRGPWEFERLWAYLWRRKDVPWTYLIDTKQLSKIRIIQPS